MDDGYQIDMFNDPAHNRDGEVPHGSNNGPTNFPVPYAFRNLKTDIIITRSDLIRELTKQIPLNEYGLPIYLYRPDLLDPNIILGSMKRGENTFVDEMMQAANVQITYEQGFPTIGHQTPMWGQLDFEPKEAFDEFLRYAELPGIRTLHCLSHTSKDILEDLFHLNYWAPRARALDMFKAAHHARLREHRIMDLEDNHFIQGEAIFNRINAAIKNKTDEELQAMDVDKLIASLEKVARLQRSAVGLSSTKGDEAPKSTSVEVMMRRVADEKVASVVDDAFDMTLLDNPETLDMAQDLIIRISNK